MPIMPNYMKPGARSSEGSGVEGSFPKTPIGGELTPAGLVSYPTGAANVSYNNGASTPASAAFDTSQVGVTPLNYKKG